MASRTSRDWRSDYAESLRLGEKVAIATLIDFKATLAEDFNTGRLTGLGSRGDDASHTDPPASPFAGGAAGTSAAGAR